MRIPYATKVGAAVLALATAVALGSPAHAAGGGGGSGTGTTSPVVCQPGMVFDEQKQICVQAEAGVLDDGTLYDQGRALALAGFYDEAITALDAVVVKDDAMVLTMLGFAKRKSGL